MYTATAEDIDFSWSSRHNLTFCVAVSRSFSILGQFRLEMIHLTPENAEEVCTMKFNNFVKSVTHSSSASTIKYVQSKLGSCKILAKISDKATQAFVSSKTSLPA